MKYSDSHTEFIHHKKDLKDLQDPDFLISQINPDLINKVKPNLLFLAINVEDSADSWEKMDWVLNEYLNEINKNSWVLVKQKK